MTKTVYCPNCGKTEWTAASNMRIACQSCGWTGWANNCRVVVSKPDPYAVARGMGERMRAMWDTPTPPKKGERLHTMYLDDDGNTVVSDEW